MSNEIIIDAEVVEDEPTGTINYDAPITNRQGTVRYLRGLADFLEKHPDLPAFQEFPEDDYMTADQHDEQNSAKLNVFADNAEQAAQIVKTIGGSWDKSIPTTSDQYMIFTGRLARRKVRVWVNREQVCTPKVVGKKTIQKPTATTYEEVEVDDIEYECGSLMSAAMQEKLARIPAKEVEA